MTLEEFFVQWHDDSPTLLVHTSGSTGVPKPMLAEKRRMEASARITCRFLGLRPGDTALLCMPLDYIAGKMMVVRALTCGLRLLSVPPTGRPLETLDTPVDFAAMVPLQVWNTLQVPNERERLRRIRHLIIGGGPVSDALASALADFPNSVWSTYGMTETLSHVALRRLNGPDRFDWYTPLDGVRVSLNDDGCLVIDAPAVHDGLLVTNDRAELRSDGRFRILGRKDNVVCSGGIKIQIEEVERLLRPHLSTPYYILGVPDERLGEQLVLLVEQGAAAAGCADAMACSFAADIDMLCRRVLPRYWVPRRIVFLDRLPLTATDKPARAVARELIAKRKWDQSVTD